jgi:gas vesicle protein
MSDLDLTKKTHFTQNQSTGSSQNLTGQVVDAGAEIKQRAGDALQASTEIVRDKFKEAADATKDVASRTAEQLQSQAREKQRSGADFVDRFAANIREAARVFENDVPFAARGIHSVAEYVEDAAEKVRNGSFQDLVENATTFARRQPAAFLGISVLAGFAAVRFLKASGGGASSTSSTDTKYATSSQYPDAWEGPPASGTDTWRQGSSQTVNRSTQNPPSQHGRL